MTEKLTILVLAHTSALGVVFYSRRLNYSILIELGFNIPDDEVFSCYFEAVKWQR